MTKAPNELEVAMTIAQYYNNQPSNGKDLQKAVAQAGSSSPPCKSYIRSIGEFVCRFCGGEGFKLLKYLDFIGVLAGNDMGNQGGRRFIVPSKFVSEISLSQRRLHIPMKMQTCYH